MRARPSRAAIKKSLLINWYCTCVHTIEFFPLPIDEIKSFRSIKSHNRTYVIFLYISDVSSGRIYSITLLLLEGKYATPSSEQKCRKRNNKVVARLETGWLVNYLSLDRRRIRSTPLLLLSCRRLPSFFSLKFPPPAPIWPVTRPSTSLLRPPIANGDLPRKSTTECPSFVAQPSPRPPRLSSKSKSHAQPARGSDDNGLVYIEGFGGRRTLLSSLDENNGRLICIVPRIGDVEEAVSNYDAMPDREK
jgi:hypothetical protein